MSKNLVLTQCTGDKYQSIRDLIYPNFRRYAEKVGAEFRSIEDVQMSTHPVLEKLRVAEYFEDYDRILLLDADLVIRPDCPDLFRMVPDTHLAAYDEGSACVDKESLMQRLKVTADTGSFYQLEPPEWIADQSFWDNLPYFNAGVMVLSKCHRNLFHIPPEKRPLPAPTPNLLCAEQGIINFRIWKERPKLYSLPVCFNQMPWNMTKNYLNCSFIVHFAGLGFDDRVRAMQHTIDFYEKFITW